MKVEAALRAYSKWQALLLTVPALISACGITVGGQGNGESYGGGDPARAAVGMAWETLRTRFEALVETSEADALFTCVADEADCTLAAQIPLEQKAQVRALLVAALPQLAATLADSGAVPWQIEDRPFPNGFAGMTALSATGPIYLSRPALLSLTHRQIVALLVHELLHKVSYQGAHVSDDGRAGAFDSGRLLLDTTGWLVARYVCTEVQRDERFVHRLYRDVLGRGADLNGLRTHFAELQAGASRAQVASAIASSPERQQNNPLVTPQSDDERAALVRAWFDVYLHRGVTDSELATLVSRIALAGAPAVEVGILASQEYYTRSSPRSPQ